MGHWSDNISRADADEIASALGLELEYDAEDGIEKLKARAAEHSQIVEAIMARRFDARDLHLVGQHAAERERVRCLAWVRRGEREHVGAAAVSTGIESGEWPPEEGA